jgi:hypothetical protein
MARSVRSIASASKTDIGRFQQFGSLELAKTQLQARWILTDAVMQRRSTSPEFQNARAMKPSGITQNRPVRVTSKPANGEGSGH